MKLLNTLLIAGAALTTTLIATGCSSSSSSVSPFQTLPVECMGVAYDGSQTLRVQGKGRNASEAIEQAHKNAVHAVIFKGITAGGGDCDARPLVTEANGEEKYEAYFQSFFAKDGEYTKYVSDEPVKKHSTIKQKTKTFVVRVITVKVQRAQLKAKLKADGIIG